MTITYHSTFKKHYKKRIAQNPSLTKHFTRRISLFLTDITHPSLRNHPLSGDLKGYYSFSITGDIRVIYRFESERVVQFYDVGTHNQVYK
ncbi:MAG: type II toxin-antitoxin system RelE/ParE family toxin [Acidobacteriota bacterium]